MHRFTFVLLLVGLVGVAACGGDDGGGSSSTGDGGGAGDGDNDGGGSSGSGGGKKDGGGSGDGGGSADGGGSGTGGGDKDGGGGDTDGSLSGDGAITDASDLDVWTIPEFDSNFADCTTLDASDDEVTATQESGAMPAAEGGTIDDGLYVLTSFEVYSPGVADTSNKLRRLVEFDGVDMTVIYFDGAGPRHDNVGTFTKSGSTLMFSIDCPGEADTMLSYSATPTTFTVLDADNSTVATYTKQ
jgi:hypothetical protein